MLHTTQSNEELNKTNDSALSNYRRHSSKSVAFRAGGRAQRRSAQLIREKMKVPPITAIFAGAALGVALLLLLNSLSSFGLRKSTSSNFVFYESSVYESRVYNSEKGKVETARRESIRTNLPELVDKKDSSGNEATSESRLTQTLRSRDDDFFDEESDRILRETMESLMKFQSGYFWDDF